MSQKGYQGLAIKLAHVASPFGSESIRQAIYCSYPDKSYIIAAKSLPNQPYQTKIVVAEFSFNDDDPADFRVNTSIINEYAINVEGPLYSIPRIFPLKNEKCFLTIINISGNRELRKIDIESGDIVWIKPIDSESIVEDHRGILFYCSNGHLTLLDSKSGNVLNRIKITGHLLYGIGLISNGDLIIGGYDPNYSYFSSVVTRNGKIVKKKTSFSFYNFETAVDPLNNLTYLYTNSSDYVICLDTDGKQRATLNFGIPSSIFGFFFLKDFKYAIIFLADSLEIYI